MQIASLRMYDFPEIRRLVDDWWTGIARHLREAGLADVPEHLSREAEHRAAWRSPDLLIAQACGYPLTHEFAGSLRVVATPCYRAPGCHGATYASLIVVRTESTVGTIADLRGAVAAYNSRDSHSGYNVLRAMLAPHARSGRFLDRALETGGHMASLVAVQQGLADVASIDCVTLALARRHRPSAVAGLRIMADSPKAPGLPYVTTARRDPEGVARLRRGLFAAMADPALADCREALLIAGAEILPEDAYQAIVRTEEDALALAYPELC